jgi:peptidoglycan/xylan/chitin deacetylase (PgdA/CDA1 family)
MLVHNVFHHCGGIQMVRWLQRNGACILMYHTFPPDRSMLEEQCEYLRQHYHVISMSELSKALRGNGALPKWSVVITVDDGHRDFFTNAYPVFAQYRFPTTLYLVTGPLDTRSWLWFDRVAYAFLASPLEKVNLPNPESPEDSCDLVDLGLEDRRMALATRYMVWVTILQNRTRCEYLKLLERVLQVDVPETPPERYALLTWEEIKQMARNKLVEFGAHTVTHPILTRVEQQGELLKEIVISKNRIESELNVPAMHFAYPSGRPQDLSPEIVAIVRNAGFATSVTTTGGRVLAGDDPFLLKRISFCVDMHSYRFRQFVAGFRP